MKKLIRYLFGLNIVLIFVLLLLIDPFSFFPKTYEDSASFISLKMQDVKRIEIFEKEKESVRQVTFMFEEGTWFLISAGDSRKYKADNMKVFGMLQFLEGLHRFEKDRKILSDSEFNGEKEIQVSLFNEMGDQVSIEFGMCFQPKSECLVREKNSRISYILPKSIHEVIPNLNLEYYLTLSPFAGIKTNEIHQLTYFLNGVLKYSIFKEEGKWKTIPDVGGNLDESLIQDLFLRLGSWTGDKSFHDEKSDYDRTTSSPSQSILIQYQGETGNRKSISFEEIQKILGNKTLNIIKPYHQFVLMAPYSWEYWRFYDIKQLLVKVD